jgi:hypothetical protein
MFKVIIKTGLIALSAVVFTGIIPGQPGRYMDENRQMRFERLDVNKDKKIDPKEWQSHFKDIDTNKDGFLSQEEMDNHHEMMMQQMDDKRPGRGPRGK